MIIYDEIIAKFDALVTGKGQKFLAESLVPWEDGGNNDMVFGMDMAFELGEGTLPAVSDLLLTSNEELFAEGDSITLVGPDLCALKASCGYGRVAVVLVDDANLEGEHLYDRIRAIQYTKYHVHPKGYMPRVSSKNHREPVRVSKEAVKNKISFAAVGKSYVDAYRKFPQVKAVKLYFITDENFDFKELERLALKSESITDALDHVLKDLTMNCQSCNLKEICDEVEGLKEMHFASNLQSDVEKIED